MNLYNSPESYPTEDGKLSIFLAGSIENGKADDWQSLLIDKLKPYDVNILNPRRPDWNPDAKQSIDDPYFNEQVNWELDALDSATLIVMYFDPNTKSPISLLELGLFANQPIVVCCPDGYWRKGNVEIVCKRNGIPLTGDIDIFIDRIEKLVSDECEKAPD